MKTWGANTIRNELIGIKEFGIDISRYQGNFNFDSAVKEGVRFVIIKGGGADDGYYVDSKFRRNYDAAKSINLPVGVYWFSHALTVDDAKKEADYFYEKIIRGRQFELPVFIDVEHSRMLALERSKLTKIVKAWCDRLEEKDCWVGIYSSLSAFRSEMNDDELQDYTHWVAQWSSACSYNKGSMGFWQFGGETNALRSNRIAGQICDQDYMFQDYPAMIKAAGKNGFSASATNGATDGTAGAIAPSGSASKKSVSQIAREVIDGKWGNGSRRKKLLAEAGYDPKTVQAEVNRILGIGQKSPADIAKEVIAGKWGNGIERKLRLKKAGYDPAEIQNIVNQILYGS